MTVLGLSPAAWVIIMTAVATYVGLTSSWLLSIPARRASILQGNIVAIEAELSSDPLMRHAQEEVIKNMKRRAAQTAGTDRRFVRRGIFLLLASFLIFTAAVVLQTQTDAAFRHAEAQKDGIP
jgi:hypothetical protein